MSGAGLATQLQNSSALITSVVTHSAISKFSDESKIPTNLRRKHRNKYVQFEVGDEKSGAVNINSG